VSFGPANFSVFEIFTSWTSSVLFSGFADSEGWVWLQFPFVDIEKIFEF
jgi:hypothetical protein